MDGVQSLDDFLASAVTPPRPAPVAGLPPVRFSLLKSMGRSPAHYREGLTTRRDSKAMRLGRATDSYILGGAQPVVFDGTRRGKSWDEFQQAHEGRGIITAEEHDQARYMADSVLGHSEAMRLLRGRRQAEINWKIAARACQAHPDVIGDGFVTDLKTSMTADPRRFTWHALRMSYHAQLAWYMDAVASSGTEKPQAAYIVVVESSAPYPVTVLCLTDRALDQGRRLFRLWFERLLVCEAADTWPGYCENIVDLDVPEDEPELVFGDQGGDE